jgi:hypothetical protein
MDTYEDIEYLDLDEDGVPDAVRTTRTRAFDRSETGNADLVETTEELAWGIDVDGTPVGIHVVETIHAALDHDGVAEVVDSAAFELPAPLDRVA